MSRHRSFGRRRRAERATSLCTAAAADAGIDAYVDTDIDAHAGIDSVALIFSTAVFRGQRGDSGIFIDSIVTNSSYLVLGVEGGVGKPLGGG